jgi:branched-chain amino acid transport system substrate-binding protein
MLGLAKDLQNNNLKKAAIVYVNVPGAIASLQATASAYAKAGVTVDKYPVPYPSPDLSATFSALSEKKPDSIVLLADPTTCNAALKAAISLGLKLPVFGTSSCGSPAFGTLAKQYGSKVEITQGSVTPTGDDADAKLYQQVMAKYGKSASDVNGFQAVNGFQTIMDLYAAVKATSGDVTPATLTATLQSAKLHQFMVGPDASFQCNGTAVPASPALCSTSIDVAAYSDGKLGATTALDVSSLVG